MLKWATLIHFVIIIFYLLTLNLTLAQDSHYDILYATLNEDSAEYHVRLVDAVSGKITEVETLRNFGSDAGWSPDGRFIYLVNSANPDARTLTLISMEDDSRQIVTNHLQPNNCSLPLWWSPDGRFLVYLTSGNLAYILDLQGRSTQLLVDTGHEPYLSQAIWSSNARYFVYSMVPGTIYIWDAHEKHLIYTLEGYGGLPSPNGDKLAYNSTDEQNHIVIFNMTRGDEQQLDYHSGDYMWLMNGRYLVINGIDPNYPFKSVLIETPTNIARMFENRGHPTMGSLWSRDGRYFAFTKDLYSQDPISVYDLVTGDTTPILSHINSGIHLGIAAWSPTEHLLAFPQVEGTSTSFWVFDIEGKTSQKFELDSLSWSWSTGRLLQWSPNGKYMLAWTDKGIGIFDREQWSMRFVEKSLPSIALPVWSANGRYIAFMQRDIALWDIGLMDMNDFSLRNLTNTASENEIIIGWRGSEENYSLIGTCGEG